MYWPFGPVCSCCTGPSGQFSPDILAPWACLVLTYWPLAPVWFWRTGPTGQFVPDVLALRASLVLVYWPSGSVCSCCNGPSGQFSPDILALWASLVLTYWPLGPVCSYCTSPVPIVLAQFSPDVLALRASLALVYWLFGSVCSSFTGTTFILRGRPSVVQFSGPTFGSPFIGHDFRSFIFRRRPFQFLGTDLRSSNVWRATFSRPVFGPHGDRRPIFGTDLRSFILRDDLRSI